MIRCEFYMEDKLTVPIHALPLSEVPMTEEWLTINGERLWVKSYHLHITTQKNATHEIAKITVNTIGPRPEGGYYMIQHGLYPNLYLQKYGGGGYTFGEMNSDAEDYEPVVCNTQDAAKVHIKAANKAGIMATMIIEGVIVS